jgi:hypothetical protein
MMTASAIVIEAVNAATIELNTIDCDQEMEG